MNTKDIRFFLMMGVAALVLALIGQGIMSGVLR